MVQYQGPNKEFPSYNSKFIRAGSDIFVTEPGNTETSHINLAGQDGIIKRVAELIITNPVDVDAGFITVTNEGFGAPRVSIGVDSMGLGIPVKEVKT